MALTVRIADAITKAAQRNDIDPNLMHALARVESGEQQYRDGHLVQSHDPAGNVLATGVMQLMPSTAKDMGVDANDAMQNIDGGARYLEELLKHYSNDETKALEAYNWGPGKLDQALRQNTPVPSSVQQYARDVESRKAEIHIAQVTIHAPGANLSASELQRAVSDGFADSMSRQTQDNLDTLAGIYHQ